jgi:hypothetical protein
MAFTQDQQELWDELALVVPKNDDLRKGLIDSFRAACQVDGVAMPSREEVAAQIAKQG